MLLHIKYYNRLVHTGGNWMAMTGSCEERRTGSSCLMSTLFGVNFKMWTWKWWWQLCCSVTGYYNELAEMIIYYRKAVILFQVGEVVESIALDLW